MRLEIKHLAPYLPYGLKALIGGNPHPVELSGLDNKLNRVNLGGSIFGIKAIKPILRPLSDLTKQIEHNGERFVPIYILHNMQDSIIIKNPTIIKNDHCIKSKNGDIFGYSNYGSFIAMDGQFHDYGITNQLELISKIFEWHFDVFELIKEDLAVDINTLNP